MKGRYLVMQVGRGAILITVVLLLSACSIGTTRDQLNITYTRAAQEREADRNPVVMVPGLMGTTLVDRVSGEPVWGGFDKFSRSPGNPEVFRALALPHERGEEGEFNRVDELHASHVLERVQVSLLGLPLDLDIYAGILGVLGVGGYRDESLGLSGAVDYGPGHYTCYQYPYDWRRDIAESARGLKSYLEEKAATIEAELQATGQVRSRPLKFDIVTHSMGGLVARYFLMYGDQRLPEDGSLPELNWAGAEWVERLILVGTPNGGSPLAFRNLLEGFSLGPFQPRYPAALLGTYPSAYQLLPRNHQSAVFWADTDESIDDLYDPAVWEQHRWGLLSDTQDRFLIDYWSDLATRQERLDRAIALQRRMLRRAEQFHRAMDRDAPTPPGLEIFAVIGDKIRTPSVLDVDRTRGTTSVRDTAYGDGTVLRSSVLNDQRTESNWTPRLQTPHEFDGVLFLPETHRGLTQSSVFSDNLLYWLLEDPRDEYAP